MIAGITPVQVVENIRQVHFNNPTLQASATISGLLPEQQINDLLQLEEELFGLAEATGQARSNQFVLNLVEMDIHLMLEQTPPKLQLSMRQQIIDLCNAAGFFVQFDQGNVTIVATDNASASSSKPNENPIDLVKPQKKKHEAHTEFVGYHQQKKLQKIKGARRTLRKVKEHMKQREQGESPSEQRQNSASNADRNTSVEIME